jgi:hypothetical protein
MSPVTRRDLMRGVALVGLGAGLSACSGDAREAPTVGAQTPTRAGRPTASTSPTDPAAALPSVQRWRPNVADVAPAVKLQAVRLVEAAGSWTPGQGGAEAAADRLSQEGFDADLAGSLTPLLAEGDAAVVEVVMAQYGGILASSASVLTVVNQWVLNGRGEVVPGGTTLDVRLVADEPRWRVTEIRPARPRRPVADLSRSARTILDNARVKLPHAAASDVESGAVGDDVLAAVNDLSSEYVVDVSVLRSGHPIRVFGTDRRSNHTDGRAVDVWAVDGRPVIERGGRDLVTRFMRDASQVGPYQIGGPVNLDGGGTFYFADATHQDHIHLGFGGGA